MYATGDGFWAGYSPAERQRFMFHVGIAVMCVPFYIALPSLFALAMGPYLFFMAIRPKREYILPIIIHLTYGSQHRFFFVLGCFLYVLTHFANLGRYSLQFLYGAYLLLSPYFLWFFIQKITGPRYVPGMGALLGGSMEYMVFSVAFWAALVKFRVDRPFVRGMIVWALLLVIVMSVFGGYREVLTYVGEEEDKVRVFSRLVFLAVPLLVASFAYFISARRQIGFELEKVASGFGCLVIVLSYLKFTRMSITFTLLGLALFAAVIVRVSVRWRPGIVKHLNPIVFFAISITITLMSPYLLERYGGTYKGYGSYDEMSVTSFDSLLKKLQRKAVDDRGHIWTVTINYIKEKIIPFEPIWTKPVPYMESYQEIKGQRVKMFVEVGSHNTCLNLIRHYGFYGGLGLYLLYVAYFCRKDNRLFLLANKENFGVVIMAVGIAEGIVGGHTGHYPTSVTFGPALFMLLGLCWGIRVRQSKEK